MRVSGDPAKSDSFTFYVEDESGEKFLCQSAVNRPELVESTKKHAHWWLGYIRSPVRWQEKRKHSLRTPCGKCELVFEFYNQADLTRR